MIEGWFTNEVGNYRMWIHSNRVRDMTRTYSQIFFH